VGRKGLAQKIGMRHDGWVAAEDYERAKECNLEMKKAFVAGATPDQEEYARGWPFQEDK
jgi:hypothetical protein